MRKNQYKFCLACFTFGNPNMAPKNAVFGPIDPPPNPTQPSRKPPGNQGWQKWPKCILKSKNDYWCQKSHYGGGGKKFWHIFSLGLYPVLVAPILTFTLLLKQETVAINPIPMCIQISIWWWPFSIGRFHKSNFSTVKRDKRSKRERKDNQTHESQKIRKRPYFFSFTCWIEVPQMP